MWLAEVATHNHAPQPPIRHPVSSIVTTAEAATALRIALVVGTSASPVDWAPEYKAPAVTGTPSRPSNVEVFPNDSPST